MSQYESILSQAIAIWQSGRRISMVLAVKLMEEGYDVPALERAYTKKRIGMRQGSIEVDA